MGIFKRVFNLINSNVNDLLDRAENPEKLMKQVVRDLERSIERSEKDQNRIRSEARRLEREIEAMSDDVLLWQKRAEMAVDDGEDRLAAEALERKRLHEKEQEILQKQLEETRIAVEQLKKNQVMLEEKLQDARSRYTSLVARGHAARVSRKAHEKVRSLREPHGVLDRYEKLERKITDMEAEAGALSERERSNSDLDRAFATKEEGLAVENELTALKARRHKKG